MSNLGSLVVVVGAEIEGFKTAMKDAVGQIDSFADEVEKRFKSIESVGQRLAEVGAGLTAAITVPLVGLGAAAITTAAQFETTQIAFTTLSGSAEAANSQLSALYKFAAETPFQVAGVLQGARTLTAMQFAAKDVIPVLRVLGDTAAGLGLGQEGLERLTFHLGQIKALGTIDGRIIREMGQAGINAGQMLADALGKTVPEVMDMVHKKAIGATTAINALLSGMQDKFGGLMEDQMKSLSGAWSNLKDNVTLALVQIGNTMLPVGKDITKALGDITEKVKDGAKWFTELPVPVQNAALAFAAVGAALPVIITGIGGLMVALPGVIALAKALELTMGELALEVTLATGGVLLLIPALVALGTWIDSHWEGIKAFANSLADLAYNAEMGGRSLQTPTEAFRAADLAAQKTKTSTDAVTKALHDLHLTSQEAFAGLSDPKATWAAQHTEAVKVATGAVQALETAEKSAGVTVDQLAAAHKRLASVLAQKMPDFTERGGAKASTKLTDMEKEHAKEIDGELQHTKALLAIETDRIKFLQKIGEIGDAQAIDQLNQLAVRELDAERNALDRKKAIYSKNLTEKQALDNQMVALTDRSNLVLQQAEETSQEHQIKSWDKYLVDIKKTFSEATKEISIEQGKILKTAQDVEAEMAKLGKIGAEKKNEGEQHALAMQRLGDERAYGLQIGKTAATEIAYAQQMLDLDRQESQANIRKLQQQKDLENDAVKKGQIDLRLSQAKNQANEREYATLTRIKQLQQQNTVLGNIQIGLWNTFNNSFKRLTGAISDALTGAKTWGAAMKSVVLDIGKEILDTLIGSVLGKLAGALAGIILNFFGVKAAASVTDVAEVAGSSAVGGAAAAAASAPFFWWNPALAVGVGAAMAASIGGAFGPLAAFETGTPFVPNTGIAMVHAGERIIDASSNRVITDALSKGLRSGSSGTTSVTIHVNGAVNPKETVRQIARYMKTAGGPQFSPAS